MRDSKNRRIRLRPVSSHHHATASDRPLFKRVLVAIDGSKSALRATEVAAKLAKRNGAELFVVCVIPRPTYAFSPAHGGGAPPINLGQYYMYAHQEAEKWLSDAVSLAKDQGIKARGRVLKNASSVVQAIADYAADQGVDLIAVGRRGVSGFKRLLIGSVSSGVVSHARSSVLVVK
jgi:nucleotide-binding universal stress UspA family protein